MKKMSLRLCLCLFLVIGTLALGACVTPMTTGYSPAPLSLTPQLSSLLAVSQNSGLPPTITAFAGRWSGRWRAVSAYSGNMAAELLIFSIKETDPPEADVLYSWEASYEWNSRPGVISEKAIFSEEKGKIVLSWKTKGGKKFTFWLNDGGNLEGITGTNQDTFVTMKRLQ